MEQDINELRLAFVIISINGDDTKNYFWFDDNVDSLLEFYKATVEDNSFDDDDCFDDDEKAELLKILNIQELDENSIDDLCFSASGISISIENYSRGAEEINDFLRHYSYEIATLSDNGLETLSDDERSACKTVKYAVEHMQDYDAVTSALQIFYDYYQEQNAE